MSEHREELLDWCWTVLTDRVDTLERYATVASEFVLQTGRIKVHCNLLGDVPIICVLIMQLHGSNFTGG